jgi:uncharacterized membrane protein
MDRAADAGEGWRRNIRREVHHLAINWLDPTRKPIDIGKEDNESRALRRQAKKVGDWDLVAREIKPIRCVDLRMVDVCDFVVVYIDTDVHACGTYEEIFLANRQKKPVLFVIEQGKENTPDWLMGAFPEEYFFSSWEDLYEYMEMIAYDQTYEDRNGRWYFFNWTGCDGDDWQDEQYEADRVVTVYHPDPSKRMRTLVKSIGWESFSFLLTLLVSYVVVGNIVQASELTVILFVLKVTFLYGYERLWHKIRWGKHAQRQ